MMDAIFTLASGLHTILEVDKEGRIEGDQLHKTIVENGYPAGITSNIMFQKSSTNRDFWKIDFDVLNYLDSKHGFVPVGVMKYSKKGTKGKFEECEIGNTFGPECEKFIFTGLGLGTLDQLSL